MHVVGTFTTADGKVAKSTRCCPPGPSRCFATWFMVSSWCLNLHLCHFCAHAFVCSMSSVFLVWHWVQPLLSVVATRILDTMEAGNCARGSACCFFCVFSIVLLFLDVRDDFWQLTRKVPSSDADLRRSCFPRKFLHTVLDHEIGIRLEALEMCYILVRWVYHPELVRNESYELAQHWVVGLCFFRARTWLILLEKSFHHPTSPLLLLPLLLKFLCQAGYVIGNSAGSLLENR